MTGAGDGCKPCLVADCGVYGLPLSTSRQLALSCAWPACHRAFPMRPPEQPRHQTFRTRGEEAWHPQRGKRPRCRRPQRRPTSGQRRGPRQPIATGDHHPLLFRIRRGSGHLTVASAATRLARRLPLRSVFVFSLRLCASKRRDRRRRRLQAMFGGGLRRLRPAVVHLATACTQLRLAPVPQSLPDAPAQTA